MKESHLKRLENVTFFIDRNAGKQLADDLIKIGLNVEKHDDHFEQDAQDYLWLEKCGEMDWVVISGDKAIKRSHIERPALLNSGIASFFFTSGEITNSQKFEIISKALKRIANILHSTPKPFIARLNNEGKVEIWINHKGEDLLLKKQEKNRQKKQKPE